jgi:hypothetical protein
MSDSRPNHRRKVSLATVIVLVLTTAVSTAVLAGHQFSDVPESNQFHGSISWMADNEITVGCNEAGTEFCPGDNVRRETMASFMRRFAQTFGAVSDTVTGLSDTLTVDSTTGVELASITVTPKAEANVVLNAHASLSKSTSAEGRYDIEIRSASCEGELISDIRWRGNMNTEASFQVLPVSLTGSGVVSADTTYVLCAAWGEGGPHPDLTVYQRSLTATWSPTS